ncbi:MAG TPA: tRNA lysidine(34) synthetase TilS [Lacipirellulaceae bacterium]|nr:tRNA lysidine(34) synthetase TilS [Lacipirellulaceae bacterium]
MANIITNAGPRHPFEERLAELWPATSWCDTHLVLAISGGPDSVALLRSMLALKEAFGGRGELHAAHLHHGMRGREADDDAAWVGALCERFKLPLQVKSVDVAKIAAEQGDGWEAAARAARYEFLRQAAERVGARFVATAHTADDQAETVLHRVLRGTGIDGLAGMPRCRALSPSVVIVRPLLNVRRIEVLAYLAAIGQDFRTDATNMEVQWTRNRLRKELLPQLRERYNPQVDAALVNLATQASEAQQVIASLAADVARLCVVAEANRVKINCGPLAGQPAIIVREVCKVGWRDAGWPEQSMGFDQWQQLASLIVGIDSKVVNLPGNVRARRTGDWVVLDRLA